MNLLVVICALAALMFVAYRGFSVILFAPVCAMLAVLFTDPASVAPVFSGIFMEKLAGFLKLYFPVLLLGAVFGKVMELAGFSKAIVSWFVRIVDRRQAILSIVLVCAALTYGGVSLFVVVFAVYPFAAELFRQRDIPKRLIPGTLALGSFSFTMDALPGSPQIQNIIPTAFFKTDAWAAPWLGIIGSIFVLALGIAYLMRRQALAAAAGEGYGIGHVNEPEPFADEHLPNPFIALSPLVVVTVLNKIFTGAIPRFFGDRITVAASEGKLTVDVTKLVAVSAVEAALLAGILTVFAFAYRRVIARFAEGGRAAVSGALLAAMNTASEYGFGAVIASLPGFAAISSMLTRIPNPLVNEAITVTVLAGITGSASGGLGIALGAMSETFIQAANTASIPLEVMHRVASMASGGMDTLPHNGAVITLLAVTGLTHRSSYRDIFAVTLIKTAAVFVVIAVYYLTGIR